MCVLYLPHRYYIYADFSVQIVCWCDNCRYGSVIITVPNLHFTITEEKIHQTGHGFLFFEENQRC